MKHMHTQTLCSRQGRNRNDNRIIYSSNDKYRAVPMLLRFGVSEEQANGATGNMPVLQWERDMAGISTRSNCVADQ